MFSALSLLRNRISGIAGSLAPSAPSCALLGPFVQARCCGFSASTSGSGRLPIAMASRFSFIVAKAFLNFCKQAFQSSSLSSYLAVPPLRLLYGCLQLGPNCCTVDCSHHFLSGMGCSGLSCREPNPLFPCHGVEARAEAAYYIFTKSNVFEDVPPPARMPRLKARSM